MTFTQDELIAALQAAAPDDGDENADAKSAVELAEELCISRGEAIKRLTPLVRDGRVVCVRKRYIRIDGTRTTIPAYRWIHEQGD
jgi:hypothetical protein